MGQSVEQLKSKFVKGEIFKIQNGGSCKVQNGVSSFVFKFSSF